MVKLKHILSEVRRKPEYDFETQQVSKDSETGSITWNVRYDFSLEDIYKDLDGIIRKMKKAIKENPNDPRVRDLWVDAKNLRNRIKRIITDPR
jgi:hypothetical protein